jgi:hypothetical protein
VTPPCSGGARCHAGEACATVRLCTQATITGCEGLAPPDCVSKKLLEADAMCDDAHPCERGWACTPVTTCIDPKAPTSIPTCGARCAMAQDRGGDGSLFLFALGALLARRRKITLA